MAERKRLLELNYIVDDDTGMYRMGEIDSLFQEYQLTEYIENFGTEGLLQTLARLTAQVVITEHKVRIDNETDSTASTENTK